MATLGSPLRGVELVSACEESICAKFNKFAKYLLIEEPRFEPGL